MPMKTKDVKHLFPCFGATSVLINIITLFVFSLFIKREKKHIYSILSDINIAKFLSVICIFIFLTMLLNRRDFMSNILFFFF